MTIEDQVASLEPSKELRELGVKQDGYFSYFQYDKWNILLRKTSEIFDPNPYWAFNKDNLICSTFTVAELGEMLPEEYNTIYFLNEKNEKEWGAYKNRPYQTNPTVEAKTEADARAKMLIYLIKEGINEANDIK